MFTRLSALPPRASLPLRGFALFLAAIVLGASAPARTSAQAANAHGGDAAIVRSDSQLPTPTPRRAPLRPTRNVPASRWLPRLSLENDAYNFWLRPGKRSDEEFTNGVTLTFESLGAPWWGTHVGGGHLPCALAADTARACLTTTITLAQDIYTPNLKRPPYYADTWRDERPYAAWLGIGAEARRVSSRALRVVSLTAGVTGKPSLGEAMQDIAHHITARWTTEAHGWETQVGFQPGIMAGVRQHLLAARLAPGGRGIFDFAPFVAANAGNILTDAEVGGKARLGVNLSHPWDVRSWRERPRWEFALTAGGRLDYVAHNFSLDGTVLHPDRRVDRTPGVSQYEFGAELRVLHLSMAYRAMTRSREYRTGPPHFTWSSMSAGIEFYR